MPTQKGNNDTALLSSMIRMIQFAAIVPDVYEMLLYTLCFKHGANGAFLTVSGTTEYFDYVVGSYKVKRHSIKGGNHVWEYHIPEPGNVVRTANAWVYKSALAGWLIGIDVEQQPDIAFIETTIMSAMSAIGFVKDKETRVDGKDPLTGLWNKGVFYRDLEHVIEITNVLKTKLWLIFIDLNNFKPVNDMLGHPMGDRILVSQGANIRRCVSDYGTIYRYGGDEFAAIISGSDEEQIKDIVRRIETTSEQSPGGIKISASAGAILYDFEEDAEAFVKRADDCMYAAKRQYKQRQLQESAS